jgi:Fe-S oxidoreductase
MTTLLEMKEREHVMFDQSVTADELVDKLMTDDETKGYHFASCLVCGLICQMVWHGINPGNIKNDVRSYIKTAIKQLAENPDKFVEYDYWS